MTVLPSLLTQFKSEAYKSLKNVEAEITKKESEIFELNNFKTQLIEAINYIETLN